MHEAAEDCGYVDPTKVAQILDVTLQKATLKNTTNHPSGNLTPRQIVRIAATISVNLLITIAEGYMDINDEIIKNMQVENKDDTDAFKREIIKVWRHKNPEDQVKVSSENRF